MAAQVRLRSFAKINLDLRVLHKRTDGFHELRTVFQTVTLRDTLYVEYRAGRTKITVESEPSIPDNIVTRAADLILKATRKTGQVSVRLVKRIPMGGGMGGGSSNAAAILLALPKLLGKPLKTEQSIEIGASLGSDVPFFLLGGTAVGIGRGTEIYSLPDLPALPIVVVASGIHVSTAEAYRDLGRGPTGDPAAMLGFQAGIQSHPQLEKCVNDFEPSVFRRHPELKAIQRELTKAGAKPAFMSGSGSTMVGIFAERDSRNNAAEELAARHPSYVVHRASLLSRSRYQSWWRKQLDAEIRS